MAAIRTPAALPPLRALVAPVCAALLVLGGGFVFGPMAATRWGLLLGLMVAAWVGITRFDLWFSAFLTYLLFETVVGPLLPGPLPTFSKDLAYLAVVGLGSVVAVVSVPPAERRPPPAGTMPLLLFLLGTVVLALRAPSPMLGALGFRTLGYLLFIALLLPLAYRHPHARRVSLAMLAVGLCLVAAIGIYEFLNLQQARKALGLEEQRWTMGTLKATSTVGSPGAFGALMGLGLVFLVARATVGRLSARGWWIGAGLFALWGTGLVLSFSRIAQMSFVLVSLLLLVRRPKLLVPGLLILMLVAVGANVATDGFLLDNLEATFGRGDNLDAIQSTHDRLDILRETLVERVPRKPLLGYGLGSSGTPSRSLDHEAPFGYLFLDNMYLKMLLDGGVFGLVLWVALLGGFILAGLRAALGGDRVLDPASRAWVWAAWAGVIYYACIGVASTVHQMPVINASLWWCVGWLLWAMPTARERGPSPGLGGSDSTG